MELESWRTSYLSVSPSTRALILRSGRHGSAEGVEKETKEIVGLGCKLME